MFFYFKVNPRRKFNRSLTEVRPDAYIFEDGLHFEVLPVHEESDATQRSHETLNESIAGASVPSTRGDRKHSIQSEESEIFSAPKPVDQIHQSKKTPLVSVRQETTSTESKDTLTPVENSDNHTLVGEGSNEDIVDLNFEGKTFILNAFKFCF